MSRFHFATVDSCAYAECSLRLGQILLTLIQPSTELNLKTNSYKERFDQLRDFLIETWARPLLQKSTSNPLIFFAEQFLSRSLKILGQERSNLIRFDGSSMFDRHWVSNENEEESDTFNQVRFLATQPFLLEKGETSKLMDNLIKDLDAELHFIYCRVAALLENSIDQYLNEARGNSHKKALLCAAFASVRQNETMANEYMQKAYKHLLAAEEEDRLYFWHHQNQKSEKASTSTAVPRPIVVARAPDFAFVIAPDFGSFSHKVTTYRFFCRAADRPNAKARMADTNYPGTNQQVCFFLSCFITDPSFH